jgi:hypothetical protein
MEIILGVVISGLIEWLKTKFKTGEWVTLAILAGVSLVGAGLYTWLSSAGYWQAVYNVLVTAGAFYAFVLKRFEASKPPVV